MGIGVIGIFAGVLLAPPYSLLNSPYTDEPHSDHPTVLLDTSDAAATSLGPDLDVPLVLVIDTGEAAGVHETVAVDRMPHDSLSTTDDLLMSNERGDAAMVAPTTGLDPAALSILGESSVGPTPVQHHPRRSLSERTRRACFLPDAATSGRTRSLESPLWMALWRGDEITERSAPEWVEHRIAYGDTVGSIARRYRVTPAEIERWNSLRRGLRPGQTLRVHTTRRQPQRVWLTHTVETDQSWRDIAAQYRVSYRALRYWNSRVEFTTGATVKLLFDPAMDWTVDRPGPTAVVSVPAVAPGGYSVGRPGRGKIIDAVQLPSSSLYTVRQADSAWGNSHALTHLVLGIADFRRGSGYEGEIVIGAISRRRGGRFSPHSSHQSGRDVDIRLPLLPGTTASPHRAKAEDIDWYATWRLVEALLATGEVDLIFLSIDLQPHLVDAARALGVPYARLQPLVQSVGARGPGPRVKHSPGHDRHIHVRFACGPDEARCRNNGPILRGR